MSFVTPSKDISKVNQVPVISFLWYLVSPPIECPYANVVIPSVRMHILLSKQERPHFVILQLVFL